MKKIVIILIGLSLFFCREGFSQKEPDVLINSQKELDRSLFLCLEIQSAKVIESWEYFAGIRMGYCIDHQYVFGLGINGIISSNHFYGTGSTGEYSHIRNTMYYGGLYFDYIIPTGFPLQVSFPTLIGVGGGFLFEEFDDISQQDAEMLEITDFLFAEPKINLELNLSRVFRIGVGCGYRIVGNVHFDRLTNKDLSGFVINCNLKFGGF